MRRAVVAAVLFLTACTAQHGTPATPAARGVLPGRPALVATTPAPPVRLVALIVEDANGNEYRLELAPVAVATPVPTVAPPATATPLPAETAPPTNTPRPTVTPLPPTPSKTPQIQATPTNTPVYTPTLENGTPVPQTPGPGKVCDLKLNTGVRIRTEPNTGATSTGSLAQGTTIAIDRVLASGGFLWAHHSAGWSAIRDMTAGAWWADGANNADVCADVQGWPAGLEPPPVVVAQPPDPPRPDTAFGLHLMYTADPSALMGLLARAGFVKGAGGADMALKIAKLNGAVTMYRPLHVGDCPPWGIPAASWLAQLEPAYAERRDYVDYMEYMNECGYEAVWSQRVDFTIDAMKWAEQRGYCLALWSFGVGNPADAVWQSLTPALDYALTHPCGTWPNGAPKYHAVAMHAYSLGLPLDDVWVFSGWRHRYAIIDAKYRALPLFLTEWGGTYTDDGDPIDCAQVARDIAWGNREYKNTPVWGYALWSFGPLRPWRDATGCAGVL